MPKTLVLVWGLFLVLLRRLRYRLFRRWIHSNDVLDYGADPYGILNSTKAIQDAIDTVGSIWVPSGNYTVSNINELLKPNASIVGEGPQNTVIHLREG